MGQPSPIRLVFWVELGPRPLYVVGSGGPRPEGVSARVYSELGRYPLRTLNILADNTFCSLIFYDFKKCMLFSIFPCMQLFWFRYKAINLFIKAREYKKMEYYPEVVKNHIF